MVKLPELLLKLALLVWLLLVPSACESMARQPEMAGSVQTAMIIAAALIEGAAFFALIVCLINGG